MDVSYARKVNVIPEELNVSKDNIWLLLNKITSILIVEIDQISKKILFSNANANRLFNSPNLVGKAFTYGRIAYGEPTFFKYKELLYEMRTSVVTWNNKPAYFIVIERNSFININKF